MGTDTPLAVLSRSRAEPVRVLPPAVRAGHEPADRSDPRGARDVARDHASAPTATRSTRRPSSATSSRCAARSSTTATSRRSARRSEGVFEPIDAVAARGRSAGGEGWLDDGGRAAVHAPPCSAIDDGHNMLILSDRGVDATRVAIPSLLALSAVQQHLVREGIRMQAGLVVETAEAREVHDVALLDRLRRRGGEPVPRARHGARAASRRAAGPATATSTTSTRSRKACSR